MSEPKYESPDISKSAFNCLHCRAYAQQVWFYTAGWMVGDIPQIMDQGDIFVLIQEVREYHTNVRNTEKNILERRPARCRILSNENEIEFHSISLTYLSQCSRCHNFAVWVDDRVVWPQMGDAPSPNSDIPDDVRVDYEEASAILGASPRGAAALLRLGVQKLCKHLGEKGDNLSADIGSLVKKGLNPKIQQALDTIRVIGNHAVHPGQIDLQDDRETARILFDLVNLISDSMIS